jgi:hypothetical protein
MKDLRAYLNRAENDGFFSKALWLFCTFNDSTLTLLVYIQSALMIASGSLVIANLKIGGLLMTLAMITVIITRDNPLLASSDLLWRVNF